LENIKTDADAKFEEINFDASDIEPMITYGTNPGMGLEFLKVFQIKDVVEGEETYAKSLGYRFQQGEAMIGKIDYVS
jgi:3-isopropylmalate/(R)-2-methylmalate dehydratase large subunit